MSESRAPIDLLSPAKDLACGVAAIDHGADAIYIGGPRFGARANASNSLADIEALAAYAHRYYARVYVTLNTIFTDEELPRAARLAHQLHEAGADALIIQDMGLLEAGLPDIALHASTQTDNRTVEKVRFLQDAGFSQVVLARELTLKEVRGIADSTTVRLEYFIHGALCVSYSGQCYLSQATTGRSANRGQCAQPCRHNYTLTEGDGEEVASGHLLSLRDMNQTENLAALIDAGVESFKIEGRLKDIGYVKNVTAWYRRHLDRVLEQRPAYKRGSSGRSVFFFTPDPEKSFNRGFTDYCANGRRRAVGSFDAPTYAGEFLGRVKKVAGTTLTVETDKEVHNGDGLSLFRPDGGLAGMRVNRVEGATLHCPQLPREVRPGVRLYRNHDQEFETALAGRSAERTIGVEMTFSQRPDRIALQLVDEDGVRATAKMNATLERARDGERARATLRTQLAKLGNTPFHLARLTLPDDPPGFLPVSVVNGLRREGVEALLAARAKARRALPRARAVEPPVPYPEAELSYLGNVANDAARRFYRKHGVAAIDEALETGEYTGTLALMHTRYCVRHALKHCAGRGAAPDAPPLTLTGPEGAFTLTFDCRRCEMKVMGPAGKG